MIATLRFSLPDEREEFECALKGIEYKIQLDEIYNFCRNRLKHGEHTESENELLEQIRELTIVD